MRPSILSYFGCSLPTCADKKAPLRVNCRASPKCTNVMGFLTVTMVWRLMSAILQIWGHGIWIACSIACFNCPEYCAIDGRLYSSLWFYWSKRFYLWLQANDSCRRENSGQKIEIFPFFGSDMTTCCWGCGSDSVFRELADPSLAMRTPRVMENIVSNDVLMQLSFIFIIMIHPMCTHTFRLRNP